MDIDRPEVIAEVRAAFDRYEKALVTNDLDVLNAIFRDAPQTMPIHAPMTNLARLMSVLREECHI